MSEHSRHEHTIRLLWELSVRNVVLAGDKPASLAVDLWRAFTALGLATIGPAIVRAVRDLCVPISKLAGADTGGFALACVSSLYSVGTDPLAPWDPVMLSGGTIHGAYTETDTVVLLSTEVTDGRRELAWLGALRAAGLRPTGCVAILDNEAGGAAKILESVPFTCLVSLKELLA